MASQQWRSKFGNGYDKAWIEQNEFKSKAEIDRLRLLPENRVCADCGVSPTVWASVNLGIFLCIICGSHHRGLGTHISKPKGCTGTYLWGPDEIERMKSMGNFRANRCYGVGTTNQNNDRPSATASDAEWRRHLTKKYDPVNRRQQEGTTSIAASVSSSSAPVPDLITFDDKPIGLSGAQEPPDALEMDFFAEFGV